MPFVRWLECILYVRLGVENAGNCTRITCADGSYTQWNLNWVYRQPLLAGSGFGKSMQPIPADLRIQWVNLFAKSCL